MRPQDPQKGFLDLGGIDLHATLEHLLHFFLVEFHELDIWVALNGLMLIINDLVVAVDTINVFKEALKNGLWRGYRLIDEDSTAEVHARLH